jgi:colanic acid/amylovoran biosynthesis glycosyltransferase
MSCPPRVALITGGLKLGGTTTFLCNLGGELVRRGIDVQVLSFERENALASDFIRLNIPTICQDERKLVFEDRMQAILRQLYEFKPSVVLANLSALSFEVLRYVPAGVFRVGTVQSDDPEVYKTVRSYASQLDLLAAVSKRIEETLTGMPEFTKLPVAYLPYGVPMPEEKEIATFEQGTPLRILYLGRLDQEQKRVRLFPGIFERLKSADIPFHWTVAGDGPERIFLEDSMRSSPPRLTVSFPGKIDYGRVPKLMSEHDVFLLASDYEGLPLSLLEAMSCGLVPVVTDLTSGIREVVDDSAGLRVALHDPAGYAKAIIWLDQHRQEARRLSENARQRVRKQFSIGAMTDRWLAAFPSNSPSQAGWPSVWHVKPPLVAEKTFRFSLLGRMLRRLVFAGRRLVLK